MPNVDPWLTSNSSQVAQLANSMGTAGQPGGVSLTSGSKTNDDLIRAALAQMAENQGLTSAVPSRIRAGQPIYPSYAPSGNSFVWFTGGSPYPVPDQLAWSDAAAEVLGNLASAWDYKQRMDKQRKKERPKAELPSDDTSGEPTTTSKPPTDPLAALRDIVANLPNYQAPTPKSVWEGGDPWNPPAYRPPYQPVSFVPTRRLPSSPLLYPSLEEAIYGLPNV